MTSCHLCYLQTVQVICNVPDAWWTMDCKKPTKWQLTAYSTVTKPTSIKWLLMKLMMLAVINQPRWNQSQFSDSRPKSSQLLAQHYCRLLPHANLLAFPSSCLHATALDSFAVTGNGNTEQTAAVQARQDTIHNWTILLSNDNNIFLKTKTSPNNSLSDVFKNW